MVWVLTGFESMMMGVDAEMRSELLSGELMVV